MKRILIIKLSALGDIFHAMPAMEQIRNKFPKAEISILTTKPFVSLFEKTRWFKEIYLDTRPKFWQISELFKNFNLMGNNWDLIIDLQGVSRTTLYGTFRRDKWVGTANSGKYSYDGPPPHRIHPHDRFKYQLAPLGINFCQDDFSLNFLSEKIDVPSKPYVVLIPGASGAHGGKKRWPQSQYGALSKKFNDDGFDCVVVGGPEEDFSKVESLNPNIINMQGKTNIFQLMYITQKSALAIGNDTGPTILSSYTKTPTITLYSGVTKAYNGGANTSWSENIVEEDLSTLTVEKVYKTAHTLMSRCD